MPCVISKATKTASALYYMRPYDSIDQATDADFTHICCALVKEKMFAVLLVFHEPIIH